MIVQVVFWSRICWCCFWRGFLSSVWSWPSVRRCVWAASARGRPSARIWVDWVSLLHLHAIKWPEITIIRSSVLYRYCQCYNLHVPVSVLQRHQRLELLVSLPFISGPFTQSHLLLTKGACFSNTTTALLCPNSGEWIQNVDFCIIDVWKHNKISPNICYTCTCLCS